MVGGYTSSQRLSFDRARNDSAGLCCSSAARGGCRKQSMQKLSLRNVVAPVFIALAVSALADPPPALNSSSQSDAATGSRALDTVTIEAHRQRELVEKQINTFVQAITMPTREEALLRWHSPICPAVVGLKRDQGEYVLARLSQAARDAGAPLAPENCGPNFLVIAASDPKALLDKWWGRQPRLFNDDRGIGGIKHFLASTQPIRAWYNAMQDCEGGAFRVRGGGVFFPEHCQGSLGSKLSWETVRVITSVVIVIDLKHVSGLTLKQMADYAAMLGLAQIRENANPGSAPTILHLFAFGTEAKPDALSSWDQAFLHSLYSTHTDDVLQVSEVEDRLYGTLAP